MGCYFSLFVLLVLFGWVFTCWILLVLFGWVADLLDFACLCCIIGYLDFACFAWMGCCCSLVGYELMDFACLRWILLVLFGCFVLMKCCISF
jgi:hypothetical protein